MPFSSSLFHEKYSVFPVTSSVFVAPGLIVYVCLYLSIFLASCPSTKPFLSSHHRLFIDCGPCFPSHCLLFPRSSIINFYLSLLCIQYCFFTHLFGGGCSWDQHPITHLFILHLYLAFSEPSWSIRHVEYKWKSMHSVGNRRMRARGGPWVVWIWRCELEVDPG